MTRAVTISNTFWLIKLLVKQKLSIGRWRQATLSLWTLRWPIARKWNAEISGIGGGRSQGEDEQIENLHYAAVMQLHEG